MKISFLAIYVFFREEKIMFSTDFTSSTTSLFAKWKSSMKRARFSSFLMKFDKNFIISFFGIFNISSALDNNSTLTKAFTISYIVISFLDSASY